LVPEIERTNVRELNQVVAVVGTDVTRERSSLRESMKPFMTEL
jgi:hypothetical protein